MAHAQVCDGGFDARRNSFVQHYGASDLDAGLLLTQHSAANQECPGNQPETDRGDQRKRGKRGEVQG
jgi:hypothetical protein